jgi:predicted RND superfamily exporter protein
MCVCSDDLATRYVRWCRRRGSAILASHLVVIAIAVYLIAFRLPLFADFSYLLPQDAPAVKDLRKLEARVTTPDLVLALVQAPSAEIRAAATADLARLVTALPAEIVERVDADDREQRAFLHAHRFLLVPLDDLIACRDALASYIRDAKLAANPLYIDLDDDHVRADKHALDDLRAKRRRAEAKLERSSSVSADGLVAKLEIRAAFRSTDPAMGSRLLAALDDIRARVVATHPGVAIGFTGSVVSAVFEHHAIANGIVWSTIVTTTLVALVLALYFRSARLLVLLVVTIAVATVASFGAAALTVGHLNAATAFLGAVIAGNGINYGIILVARYVEERRRREVDDALATAIVHTARPTAIASVCASIAYGSLAASSFKGFADFAVIGAIGMSICWIATYVLLPTLILKLGPARVRQTDPLLGSALVRLVGFRNPRAAVAVVAVLAVAAAAVVVHYIAADPFEYDGKQLRAESDAAVEARRWLSVSDREFGRQYTGRTFIAADDIAQVPRIVDALRARDRASPGAIGDIRSILDVVPANQPAKLAVLADIRKLLDGPAVDALDDRERAELVDVRPPDDLAPITIASLPASLRGPLTEKDGRVGYVISIQPADALDDWNGHDLVRFSNAVNRLDVAGDTITTSGASVIFVDVLQSIERDTPVITAIAAIGIAVLVVVVVGRNRRAVAVLAATGAGSLLMIATCALVDLKVTFLDFVALPITLGLGVDYAINLTRDDDAITTLRTSGSAVFVCSLTTIIGYASLLVGDNLAIRGFGLAALIGELTCVITALVLVPALLAIRSAPR